LLQRSKVVHSNQKISKGRKGAQRSGLGEIAADYIRHSGKLKLIKVIYLKLWQIAQ
jgi:hypothetical protein